MSIKSHFRNSVTQANSVLFLIAVAFSGTTYANQCGDISQSLAAMGDSYYELNSRNGSTDYRQSEQQTLLEQSDVFAQLRDTHFEHGTGERTRCFGTKDYGRAETSTLELEDITQQDNSYRIDRELQVEAYEYDDVKKVFRHESIYFPSNQNTTIVTTADGKELRLNTRRRQATEIGTNFRETLVSATSTNSGVDIKQLIYINGYLAEWVNWSLTARKSW